MEKDMEKEGTLGLMEIELFLFGMTEVTNLFYFISPKLFSPRIFVRGFYFHHRGLFSEEFFLWFILANFFAKNKIKTKQLLLLIVFQLGILHQNF
jgi:hypothetical protein